MARLTPPSTPVLDPLAPGGQSLPAVRPRPPVQLFYGVGQWTASDGHLLPVVEALQVLPGLDGVERSGSLATAVAVRSERGRQPIPQDWATAEDTPDGQPGYLRAMPVRGGTYHYLAWDQPQVTRRGTLSDRGDPAAYRHWLQELVRRGRIPPPTRDELEELRTSLLAHLQGARNDDVRAGLQARLMLVDTAIAKLDAGEDPMVCQCAPTTPPKRRRKEE